MKFSPLPFSPYDLPLILFLASAVLGLLPGYDPSLGYKTLAALACGVFLYFIISRLAVAQRWWKLVAIISAALFGIVALFFVTQAGYLGNEEKVGPIAHLAGIISSIFPSISFWHPLANSVATFLEGGLFLVLGLALTGAKRNSRILYYALAATIGLALLLSSSRGAWLAVFSAGLIWAGSHWKPARYLLFALGLGLIGLIVWVILQGDITAINQVPIANSVLGPLFIRPDRLEVYRNSVALIADVPFTGIGLGNQFALVYSRYALLLPVPFLYYAHNLFLEIWLEQGLIGAVAWVWIWGAVLSQAFTQHQGRQRLRFEATWISLAAIFIHSLSDARQAQSLWCWLPFFINLALNGSLQLHGVSRPIPKWCGYLPPALAGCFVLAAIFIFQPLSAVLLTNQAASLQQKADLTPGLSSASRDQLRRQAYGQFQQALEQQPANRSANQRTGYLELDARDYPSAIRHLEAAMRALPTHPGIRKALGLAYTFQGAPDKAVPLLGGLPKIVDELNYWGWYYSTHGAAEIGLNAYRVSLRINPDQPDVQSLVDANNPGK